MTDRDGTDEGGGTAVSPEAGDPRLAHALERSRALADGIDRLASASDTFGDVTRHLLRRTADAAREAITLVEDRFEPWAAGNDRRCGTERRCFASYPRRNRQTGMRLRVSCRGDPPTHNKP